MIEASVSSVLATRSRTSRRVGSAMRESTSGRIHPGPAMIAGSKASALEAMVSADVGPGAAGIAHGRLPELASNEGHLADVVGIVLRQERDETELSRVFYRETVHPGPPQLLGGPAAHDLAEVPADRAPPLALLRERRPVD